MQGQEFNAGVGDTAEKRGCADSQAAVKQPRAESSQEEAAAPGRLEGQEEQVSIRLQGTEPAGRSVSRAGSPVGAGAVEEMRKENIILESFFHLITCQHYPLLGKNSMKPADAEPGRHKNSPPEM